MYSSDQTNEPDTRDVVADLRGRMSETVFRRVFFAGLLLVGAHLVLKALAR